MDVTRELNLPWATVHRTMIQLEKAQFLRRDPETNRYEIGPRLWYVGSAYLANHRVLKAAMPYLGQAQDTEGVVVQIVERIGFQSVVVYSAQRPGEDITKAHYGYPFPAALRIEGAGSSRLRERRLHRRRTWTAISSG